MINLTLTEALQKLNTGEISAVELTRCYLDRIEKYGADLNCYITTTPERAMADAAASDARRAAGDALPLDGTPIAMKDLFATRSIRTTAAEVSSQELSIPRIYILNPNYLSSIP